MCDVSQPVAQGPHWWRAGPGSKRGAGRASRHRAPQQARGTAGTGIQGSGGARCGGGHAERRRRPGQRPRRPRPRPTAQPQVPALQASGTNGSNAFGSTQRWNAASSVGRVAGGLPAALPPNVWTCCRPAAGSCTTSAAPSCMSRSQRCRSTTHTRQVAIMGWLLRLGACRAGQLSRQHWQVEWCAVTTPSRCHCNSPARPQQRSGCWRSMRPR